MKKVSSFSDFIQLSEGLNKHFLLLFKSGNEQSNCAVLNLQEACAGLTVPVFFADVVEVRDIHPVFNITTVPSLLIFENSDYINTVHGCQPESFYSAILQNATFKTVVGEDAKPAKSVTVYSTPSCTWCNTLKRWLDKYGIQYRDIDVSRDENAARDLVNRSGQQGVPQTEINGTIVVGFDEARLKRLLEI
jgi:glutaredoxin-like YruB-family protein